METAAKLSSKLEQNIQNRQQQKQLLPPSSATTQSDFNNTTHQQQIINKSMSAKTTGIQYSNSGGNTYQHQQQPNIRQLQSAKIGGNNNSQTAVPSGLPRPMKRLLNHSAKRQNPQVLHQQQNAPQAMAVLTQQHFKNRNSLSSNALGQDQMDGVQIINRNGLTSSDNRTQQINLQQQADDRQILTQMQIYNRMQQAKLLGHQSQSSFQMSMPEVKKRNSTLSNLLAYQSPKSDKRSRGLQQNLKMPKILTNDTAKMLAMEQQSDQQLQYYGQKYDQMVEPQQNNVQQIQVRLDRSSRIFKDPKSTISPIISEGSQTSQQDEKQSNNNRSLVPRQPDGGGYEVVETSDQLDRNANILIKDYQGIANQARQQEPFLQRFPLQNINEAPASPKRIQAYETVTSPKAPVLSPTTVAIQRDLKVHGINQNNQKLFFDTKQVEGSEKVIITVPIAKQSKFGPPGGAKKDREYVMVKLTAKELDKVMSESTKAELEEIKNIQKEKDQVKQEVFFEDIYTFPIEMRCERDRKVRKRRNLDIGQRLQEEREQDKWEKREEAICKGQRQKTFARADTSGGVSKDAAAQALGGGQFDYMNIDELKQHENGILNLFEGEKHIANYVSHNKPAAVKESIQGQKLKKYVRLSQYEYETIFEKDPSFNEKKAFVEVFRKKWKEDKGFCSMFDKRQNFRKAKSAAIGKREKNENAHMKFKAQQERQMLLNHRNKLVRKEQEQFEKEMEGKLALQALKRKEERASRLLFKKALRRTRSKNISQTARTAMHFNHLPNLKQAENYESNMFPLTKTESVEDIIYYMSNTCMGAIQEKQYNNRAKSAHVLGARSKSLNNKSFSQANPRIESSKNPQYVREFSSKPTELQPTAEVIDEEMNLTGRPVTMHQPLQNHDNDFLSNFITQMYQTNTMYNPPQKNSNLNVVHQNSGISQGQIYSSGGFGIQGNDDTVGVIEGTLDSVIKDQIMDHDESKTDTMKFNKLGKETTGENTGRMLESGSKEPGLSVHLNEKDIKIVAQPPKLDQIQKNKKDLHLIQSQLDRNMLTFKVTRDPRSAKTLPIRKHLLLGQQDEKANQKQHQKTIFSHREQQARIQIDSKSPKRAIILVPNEITVDRNNSIQSERRLEQRQIKTQETIHSTINRDVDPTNQGTRVRQSLDNGQQKVRTENRQYENIQTNQVEAGQMFLSGDQTALLKQRQSQLTDSKDSKLSDEIHERSFMQPKNHRESFDSRLLDSGDKQAINQPAAQYNAGIGIDSDVNATFGSKEKLSQNNINNRPQKMKNALNADTVNSRRGKDSNIRQQTSTFSNLKQLKSSVDPTITVSNRGSAQNQNNGNFNAEVMSNGIQKDENAPVSRQNRITVNSSYRSRPNLESKDQFQAQQSTLQERLSAIQSTNHLPNDSRNIQSGSNPALQHKDYLSKDQQQYDPLNQQHQPDHASSSNQDLMPQNMSRSHNGNPFDEWTAPEDGIKQSKLDILMQSAARPSVYNLPHNPMNHRSYACNYIKARVETTRMDFIQSQNNQNQFKIEPTRVNSMVGTTTDVETAYGQDLMLNGTSASGVMVNGYATQKTVSTSKKAHVGRAMSANRPVSTAYLRNQKLVQLRKKEQQFCYYLQQHRQNKQLLESLEKQATFADTNQIQSSNHLLVANSDINVTFEKSKQNFIETRKSYDNPKAKSQTRQQKRVFVPGRFAAQQLNGTPSNQLSNNSSNQFMTCGEAIKGTKKKGAY